MSMLVISRPDPPEWTGIRAKWGIRGNGREWRVTYEGKDFASDAKPFTRKMDAERQADANARSEMFDVLYERRKAGRL